MKDSCGYNKRVDPSIEYDQWLDDALRAGCGHARGWHVEELVYLERTINVDGTTTSIPYSHVYDLVCHHPAHGGQRPFCGPERLLFPEVDDLRVALGIARVGASS